MGRKALPRDEMDLTEREHLVLDYLTGYISSRGYPPTVREICQYLGIKSTSTIHRDLHELEKRSFILRDPAKPRTIEILNSGRPDSIEGTEPATEQEMMVTHTMAQKGPTSSTSPSSEGSLPERRSWRIRMSASTFLSPLPSLPVPPGTSCWLSGEKA